MVAQPTKFWIQLKVCKQIGQIFNLTAKTILCKVRLCTPSDCMCSQPLPFVILLVGGLWHVGVGALGDRARSLLMTAYSLLL